MCYYATLSRSVPQLLLGLAFLCENKQEERMHRVGVKKTKTANKKTSVGFK